jgi:hypothetical protein
VSANWLEMTSATGGTGALTLTAVSGAPTFANVFGASGTRRLPYAVLEWGSSARTGPPIKSESGWGEVNLATSVLTRTRPETTWNGTNYDGTVPSAISFGTTAANIRVILTPLSAFAPTALQAFPVTTPSENLGAWSAHLVNVAAAVTVTAAREYYVPFHWRLHGEYAQFGVGITTTIAASGVKIALYDVASTGLPGIKRQDLAAGTPIDSSGTAGIRAVSLSNVLPPGWYYAGILPSHAVGMRAGEVYTKPSPACSMSTGMPITHFYRAGTYATGLPDPAPTAGSLTGATTAVPLMFLKAG